jgi:hypothetical protein
MRFYAGIGSRTTPPDTLTKMRTIATRLEKLDFVLRSGGAAGADFAFASAVTDRSKREIFRPENATPGALAIAAKHHPVWDQLSEYVKNLHGRNAQIVLGRLLNQPVEFVVCWTPIPVLKGGTKMGIDIANERHIPVYNLFSSECENELEKRLAELENQRNSA